MEAKFLASVFSFLSIFLAIYAETDLRDFETAIYYGDSNVNIGEPFSITCIIPLDDPIGWLKDDEPITRHNLRHGRDEHSYTLSESAIEGEKHKIEAHLSVRHALKGHEGKYQCNDRHSSYHVLRVRSPVDIPKPQTKSPFIITSNDNRLSTDESVFETFHDLTPNSADELFTRLWEPEPASPVLPLPTQTATTTHRRQHHHHHQQQQQQQQQHKDYDQRKLIYINATNFDGSPSVSSSGGESRENIDLVNLEHLPPPTNKYNELTTVPWRSSTPIVETKKYPPMPVFPPPRNTMLTTTMAPPVQYYTPIQQPHHTDHRYHVEGAGGVARGGYNDQLQTRYPAQTMQTLQPHQLPPQQPMFTTYQSVMYPTQTSPAAAPQTPYQQYNVAVQTPYPTYPQQQQLPPAPPPQPPPQHVTAISTATAATLSASSATSFLPSTTFSVSHPKAYMPIRNDLLMPNYDHAEQRLKVYDIRQPLVLSCNITKEGNFELIWEKNGTNVAKVQSLNNRHRILKAERKFIIDRTDENDAGTYTCGLDDQKATINVVAKIAVRVPSNTGVVEGEKMSIVCTVVGTEPQLSWKIGNLTLSNSTGRYILKPDDKKIENAILSVENVSLDDRGDYTCVGINAANIYLNITGATDSSFVRVKGKLAALWPFLGICAEVLILCAIILIYEKRRNRTELEESDTDPQEQKKKRRNYD